MTANADEGATVLVADGSRFGRAWAERLLTERGHRVMSAPDGRSALATARDGAPDVLVAHEHVSGMAGLDLARALREGGDDVGIVLLTGAAGVELEAEALRTGVDECVRTPCSADAVERAVRAACAAGATRRARRQREHHNAGELRDAAQIQAALLPPPVEVPAGWSLGCGFVPSSRVGGDVFDILRRGERSLVIVVADVSGKGVAAGLLGGMLQAALRSALSRGDAAAAALASAGRVLFEPLERAGRFLTAAVVEVDLLTGRLRHADAGHGHHLLIDAAGGERPLPGGGPPLGFLPEVAYEAGEERMAPGEVLALFSDGLVEGGAEPDPVAARAALAARVRAGVAPERLAAGAPDADDRTIVVLGRRG